MSLDLEPIKRHIEPWNGCPECQVRELVEEVERLREEAEVLRKDQEDWFAYLRWRAGQDEEPDYDDAEEVHRLAFGS